MTRIALFVLLFAACEKKPAPPAGDLVDEGVLVTSIDGKITAREKFSIRKVGEHLVIRSSSETVDGAATPIQQTGELETDLAYHPLRLDYHYMSKAESFRYTLSGTPLRLDRIRDDGDKPEHADSVNQPDVFVEAPGLIALTPVCKVTTAPSSLSTMSTPTSGFRGKVNIKTVATAGKLKRLTIGYLNDFEIELYCDGDKMIASGLRGNKLWNVREGREADFEAARDAK